MQLTELVNRHEGQVVGIYGTGPSLDDLLCEDLTGPRIYLNRASMVLPHSPGETYWLVADDVFHRPDLGRIGQAWDDHLTENPSTVRCFRSPMLGGRGIVQAPAGVNVVRWAGIRDRGALSDSRARTAAIGGLYMWSGTASPAIHLAWLMGASAVHLVGIDGAGGHARCLDHLYDDGRAPVDYHVSRDDAMFCARALKMELVTHAKVCR